MEILEMGHTFTRKAHTDYLLGRSASSKSEENLIKNLMNYVTQNRWSSESNVSLLRHCRVATEEDEVKSRKRSVFELEFS